MKKKHKKLKGMTLIECMIAIAILGVTGLIMVQVGSVVTKLMLNTNHLTNKTNAEAPTAKVQNANDVAETDASGNAVDVGVSQTITVTSGSASGTVQAKKYSTQKLVKDVDGNVPYEYQTNGDGDIEFYIIEPATEATT